ncbi:aldo/keto reductase [Salinicola halimionae]|uniref:aldo/keto reductase n=1 Tax=Salinicola halimionae TaxID=1949081 RepID=UPI001CB6C672|nr:aldo/keto reductase [Salinicola halimionae]
MLDTVLSIADELGASADQVAIAWAGSHGAVPMIGPRSTAQLAGNLGAITLELSTEQIQKLDSDSGSGIRSPISWVNDEQAKVIA